MFLVYPASSLKIDILLLIFIYVDAEDATRTKSSAAHLQLQNLGPASSAAMQTLGVAQRVIVKLTKTQTCSLFFLVHAALSE